MGSDHPSLPQRTAFSGLVAIAILVVAACGTSVAPSTGGRPAEPSDQRDSDVDRTDATGSSVGGTGVRCEHRRSPTSRSRSLQSPWSGSTKARD